MRVNVQLMRFFHLYSLNLQDAKNQTEYKQ